MSEYHGKRERCTRGTQQHEGGELLSLLVARDSHHSGNKQALLLCKQLQGVGLTTNESAIRVLNCSDNDTGQTEHHAIVIVKPTTGPEEAEEQLTYLCADPALGTETIFSLARGTIPPARQGLPRRAVATRLPFDGAPAGTVGVLTGVILQSKAALAQRLLLLLSILKAGLRQMVLEASTIAMDEQRAILSKQQATADAGVESSSQDNAMRAARSAS